MSASGDGRNGPVPAAGERDAASADGSRGGERTGVRAGAVAQRAAQEVRAALRPFTIPNGITLIRLALTPFFVLAILEGNHRLALGIFVAAGISDALDGLIARLLGMRSLLGSYLDPIADKTLLVTAYVALTLPVPGAVRMPLWLTVMALSRDFLIVLVALLLYLGAGVREFPPSLWGKWTTFLHILTVAAVLVANVTPVPERALLACFYIAMAFTVISGADYVRRAALTIEAIHDDERR
ncbi:MAG: CDP-alcohol phosphatidyltransferase family protein [Thermoanaerobaculaceae bacterium]|nr:CDP-alcohol phosphatidyltransferase family protein [Thermoanaerobaculaceae bacterium]TAM52719.1 MAG: CDP-alcohol phosphatidyltransferase family protein [Acidobacteriota bacterium]